MDWFIRHQRDLPWRKTYSPYHVWISEIMLQQTQMERGVEYFKRWMRKFPDIATLAEAHEDDVLKLWEGLGYYSRARNLHKTARILHTEHAGRFPSTPAALQKLPGIGPYTARAIAAIAFERDVCVVDANVERVCSRLYNIDAPVKAGRTRKQIESLCWALLPPGQARAFSQALMEFGSLVCTPRTPDCLGCPMREFCAAHHAGVVDQRPVLPPPIKPIFLDMATGVLRRENKFFVQKRLSSDVWANLWEFPGGVVEDGESPEQAVIREYLEETKLRVSDPMFIGRFKHSHTKYRITMHAFFVQANSTAPVVLTAAQEYRWVTWKELQTLAFPAGHRKLIKHLAALRKPETGATS
jgi:A/G-specific adenine glycosylase